MPGSRRDSRIFDLAADPLAEGAPIRRAFYKDHMDSVREALSRWIHSLIPQAGFPEPPYLVGDDVREASHP
jgi:hypothetical protein